MISDSLLEKLLNALPGQIEKAAHLTLLEAGNLGQEAARNTNRFKNNGPLRAATNFHETGEYTGFVLADKSYAIFLEDGNNAGGAFIYPVHAKALHFKIDGKDIFAKKVRSHGPLPFMKDAQEKVENNIEEIFNKNFDKIFGG
jgi:hypothetical protein